MNPETEKALRGSCKKWEGIKAGTVTDDGIDNCELCQLFYVKTRSCSGCPVMDATGLCSCLGTPYEDWVRIRGISRTADTPVRKRAAQAELDFLKSLLPAAPDAENGAKP